MPSGSDFLAVAALVNSVFIECASNYGIRVPLTKHGHSSYQSPSIHSEKFDFFKKEGRRGQHHHFQIV